LKSSSSSSVESRGRRRAAAENAGRGARDLPPERLLSWTCAALERAYGRPSPIPSGSPLDVLVATILSQNTNDRNRDEAYRRLTGSYPTWEDVAAARIGGIEAAIKPAGLFRGKSRAIRGLLRYLIERYGRIDRRFLCRMTSARAVEELTALKGIGVKTVSVALMFGCGRDDVFPVDTHVLRVSKRLGLLPEGMGAEAAHGVMIGLAPRGKPPSLHLNMIRLGREVCRARRPTCGVCPLASRCPWPVEHTDAVGVAPGGDD
jgi:endonuclease-3